MEPQCCSCAFIWSARIVIEYRCLHCHVNVHSQDEIGFANTVPMYAPAYTNVLILVRSLDGAHREMMAWNAGKVTPSPNLRHYDKSSEYAAARQHKVAEVACYRIEGTLMGCADPPSKGLVHPIGVLELAKNKVDGGSLSPFEHADSNHRADACLGSHRGQKS